MSEPDASTDPAYMARCRTFYAEHTRPQMNNEQGQVVPEWAIDAETGRYLYNLARRLRVQLTLEIGCCQGASALHFASAHAANGAGLHIAIDPFQEEFFRNQGSVTMERFGLNPWFKLLTTRSDRALPLLHAAGMTAGMIFIDGDHRFDAVFTDYYFADKLLPPGGFLIFDEGGYDCPTKRVASFIAANMPNLERIDAPVRLYCYKKTGNDQRSFADAADF